MDELRYMISDASKKVSVEAHVLRYWEEELEMEIPRNEMGHRYYTEEHIRIFKQVKQLKDSGYQLKAVKMLLPKLKDMNDDELHFLSIISEEMNRRALAEEPDTGDEPAAEKKGAANIIPMNPSAATSSPISETDDKMQQFQAIMTGIMSQALQQNSERFLSELEVRVTDRMLKELNYNIRQIEEMQEQHFRQIDAAIHNHREAAAARVPRKLFERREKKRRQQES